MLTLTQAWLDAAQNAQTRSEVSGQYAPIWLVEILGINTCYTTRAVTFSRERQLGDGGLLGNGMALGDYLPTYGRDLAGRSGLSSPTVELTDDYSRPQVSGATVQLLNQEGLLRDLQESLLDNAAIRIRLGFVGLGYDDFIDVWRGVIDSLEDTQDTVVLSCVDGSFLAYPSLSQPLSPQYFPATPQANKSRAIPLLLGLNRDVETIQVSGAARGLLAVSITSTSTSILLKEFGAPFPASGSISIGTEVSITYANRALLTHPTTGVTTLQLNGLVRSGTPASHAVDEAVVLVSPNYDYLIGYAVSDIQAVRGNGTLISPGSYTVLTQQAGSDVTVLRFTSAPSEPVTVDVNAGSVDDSNLLTNGDFEAGTLSGWTTGAGATAAVGTASPAPQEGTYRASLEGDQGTYKDLYQEVGTIPGADYILAFWRQDADTNLLTNGGFEAGDLTGWTVEIPVGSSGGYILADTEEPAVIPGTEYSVIPFIATSADGRYAFYVRVNEGEASYALYLTQDFTTTIGLTYTLSFAHISGQFIYSSLTGSSTLVTGLSIAQLSLILGTPTSPGSLIPEQNVPFSFVVRDGLIYTIPPNPVGIAFTLSDPYVFVATDTTTRLTFHLVGRGVATTLVGTSALVPASIGLDGVRVQNASLIDTAECGYQLGTSADPDSIAAVTLPAVYRWAETRARFRATDTTTRLTLQSRHTTTTARTSYFDNVVLQRVFIQNYNPVEQIRYILRTFLPQKPIDESSFVTAYDARILWRFGTVLFNPGDSKALINRMAMQCGCLLIETAGGAVKIVARDNTRQTVYGFVRSNIVQGSFRTTPELLDNIYTEVYVWFGARTGGSTQASDFAASTYATPETTTHPLGSLLTSACAQAQATYKRSRRLDIYAEFIQDITTANLLLLYEVQRRTVRRTVVTFQTWLDAAQLEVGDIIAVEDPRYPTITTIYDYEVVSITAPTPDSPYVTIRARSERDTLWLAHFDYQDITLDTMGFYEPFEA